MFVVDAARRDGLCGHVRNLSDGQVEAAAEGDAEAITRFEAALWRGPARARVEHIVIDATAPTGHAGGFTFD